VRILVCVCVCERVCERVRERKTKRVRVCVYAGIRVYEWYTHSQKRHIYVPRD